MASVLLDEIQSSISQLPYVEKLLLAEWIIHNIRTEPTQSVAQGQNVLNRETMPGALDHQLVAMANDPEIQTELSVIGHEFAITEMDGLEDL